MNNKITNKLDNDLIPPEIKNDAFYIAIQKMAREENIKTVLEIGSSSGEGSTEAFVTGLQHNPNNPILFCMEVSTNRFNELKKRYENEAFVKCYNVSSVPLESFPDEKEVIDFYNSIQSNLNFYPLELILGWLKKDIEYVKTSGVSENGIEKIKQENNIDFFDLVLIDGSEFTGNAELEEIYGAKIICLDDIITFKNYATHQKLLKDPNYILIEENHFLRNGYSIFKKIEPSYLPIHFFTIVLNGQPFILYHIDVLKTLPFTWHWHIVEGVADLKHDTSWSVQLGGRVSDSIHKNGRSYDGTTEYIDELAQLYPENITIYRKPEEIFWDGKREMVNVPLSNIQEECLLWQIDVDELWTFEQICTTRKLFATNPDKTAAFYWCWYFVGEKLIISTRNCYAQNPRQEWLRTWRFKPGAFWAAHEPPVLVEALVDGQFQNVAAVNPFLHQETENCGLIFQHFAYVTSEQLQFKEQYYGYKNAVSQWQSLQKAPKFPVMLREYFPWVGDETRVDTAESYSVVPITQRDVSSNNWQFLTPDEVERRKAEIKKPVPIILVDAVFFQLEQTGIARIWQSLLQEWANNGFAKHIIVLDREGTIPKISGIKYRTIPYYDYNNTDVDRKMLQQVCDQEDADLFISSYYTTPTTTPSVFMAYDMIPEVMGWNIQQPTWQEKHQGIHHACSYIAISNNTAHDLAKFFPDIPVESITVAYCGLSKTFSPAKPEIVHTFKTKYGITKPCFILVGIGGYQNSILFFQAISKLASSNGFDIVITESGSLLPPELRRYTSGMGVYMLQLNDQELAIAYSGAVALVYPSKYEGFGMPVAEAIACGCPVITCPNASIPEVAGNAAIYVPDNNVDALANALCDVQKTSVRNTLINTGLEQAKNFSWSKMAEIASAALIDATLLKLNLKEINYIIFPDWTQPEDELGLEIAQVIKILASHPDSEKITLLVNSRNSDGETVAMFLSSIMMDILMSEDLVMMEELEITPLENLGFIQWEALLPRIYAKITLIQEDSKTTSQLPENKLKTLNISNILDC
ncbi:MAG: glycosyltransferase family 1 protein [Nostocales cyanobacterium ELA583]|jgi:hypothetical protein